MQLIILYNKPLVIDISENCSTDHLKSEIYNHLNIVPENQFIQFAGKNLINDTYLNDYNIKNNSIIFLNQNVNGGYVAGFPNIGHLIILLSVSTIFLIICYTFFSNMMNSFNVLLNPQKCNPLQTGGAQYDYNFLYKMTSMFYSSIFVIIVTIYGYTLFCNSGLSDWLLVLTLASFIIIFLVLYFLYQLVKRGDVGIDRVSFLGTITFASMSIILLLLTFVIPAIKRSRYLHWTTYLYPIGILTITFLFHKYSNYMLNLRFVVISLLAIVAFVFVPYTLAYVYNVSEICKN